MKVVKHLLNRLIDGFKEWLSRKLPDCQAVTPTIGSSFDRKLGLWERSIVRLHLFTCDRCERYFQHLRFMNQTLGQHGETIADPDAASVAGLRNDSKEKLKALLSMSQLA